MKLIQPKIVLGVVVVIVITLFISLANQMNRRLQVQHEVNKLQVEVQSAQRTIVEMENLNRYFSTDAYQERLAREKLNYQAPGEKVVLIPNDKSVTTKENTPTTTDDAPVSIPEKWWGAFFVADSTT